MSQKGIFLRKLMTDKPSEEQMNESRRKEEALEGLRPRQKAFVKELSKHNSISGAARAVGYAEKTANVTIYRQIKSPKLRRAITAYHSLGDLGLGDLGAATILDLLTSSKTKDEVRANVSRLALQISGKLKNFNINTSMNLNFDVKDEIMKLLSSDD